MTNKYSKFRGYGGHIIGIIGITLSIHFYLISREIREPILAIDPYRTRILYSDNISYASIKVFKEDGKEIKADLTMLRIYFWNNGKRAIKSENVLSPIIITTSDSSTKILDVKLARYSRKISGLKFVFLDSLKNSFEVQFDILEKNDGGVFQILFEGNYDSEFTVRGTLEESGDVCFSNKELNGYGDPRWLRIVASLFISILFLGFAGLIIVKVIQNIKQDGIHYEDGKWSVFIRLAPAIVFSLVAIGIVILVVYLIQIPLKAIYIPTMLL